MEMFIKTTLDEDTNFFFAEIVGDPREEGMTGIIIDAPDFEINLFCELEQAEQLAKQLQKYVQKQKMRVIK